MSDIRFSVGGLLHGVVLVALLLSSLPSLTPDPSNRDLATGGLGVAVFAFAVISSLCEHSSRLTLLHCAVLYTWGMACVLVGEAVALGGLIRCALAVAGVAYAAWAWMTPALPRLPATLPR